MSFDPIADVLRAHDTGLVLLSGPLECPGHVLLPWFAHAAALRKVQQQTTQQTTHAPLPVVYVEPRLPGPDDEDEEEDDGNCGGGWLRRLSADVASAVRQQAEALMTSSSSPSEQRRLPQPPQITVLVDSLTVLAAAADAGAGASSSTPSTSASITAPRPSPTHLRWLAFLHTLASLEAQAPNARVRVVALCADDVPSDAAWRRWLRHRCSAALTLCPVEGRTAGLDGEMRVEARAAPAADVEEEHEGGLVFADRWGGAASGGGGNSRCFFRASELSVRWLRDVQSADLMR